MANKQIPAADIGATNYSFRANTSDGADNAYLGIVGGGNESVNRGGAVYVYGNEYSGTPGSIQIQAGNVANSRIEFKNSGAVVGLVNSAGLEMNYPITLSGNVSSAGSSVRNINGNGNANDLAINVPSSGKFEIQVNGSGRYEFNSTVLYVENSIRTYYDLDLDIGCGSIGNSKALRLAGSADPGDLTRSACLRLHGVSHATYPGAHQSFANLSTRAASTAIALCPAATGDMAYVTILESSIASCKVKVDTAGTVTFTDLDGNAASASIVNSSSPAAAEYGVYISAGVLYFKGGSSYAGKMSSFSQIGKA